MPGPLEGLKKATRIGPDPHPQPHPEEDWIGTGVQGLLGMVGLGDSESRANLGGQLVTAGLPLAGLKGTFSRLTRAMEGLPATAHPNKILGIAKNLASPEEVEYRGLSNFLKGKGNEAVPREDVLGHLEGHPMPEIGVKRLGEPQVMIPGTPRAEEAKYGQYQLPGSVPGSYREDLLTLHKPLKGSRIGPVEPNVEDGRGFRAEMLDEPDSWIHGDTPEDVIQNAAKDDAKAYMSPHWNEPNVLAHVRHNEREIPKPHDPKAVDESTQNFLNASDRFRQVRNDPYTIEKDYQDARYGYEDARQARNTVLNPTSKGRMIENVQSDWHQAGAKGGYRDDPRMRQLDTDAQAIEAQLQQMRPNVTDAVKRLHASSQRTENPLGFTSLDNALNAFGLHADGPVAFDELGALTPQDVALVNDYITKRRTVTNNYDTVRRLEHAPPDAPFKDSWAELALKHQVLDVANRPDLEWMGFTPGEELVKRGEGQSPDFNNRILPDKLAKLLKPFGGKMEQVEVPTGKSVTPDLRSYYNPTVKTHQIYDPYNQSTGELGGEHLASVWPRAGKGPTGNEDLRAANLRRTIESQRTYPINVQAWIAKLPASMKEAILKKGFPLMSLLGLVGANQSQQPEQ